MRRVHVSFFNFLEVFILYVELVFVLFSRVLLYVHLLISLQANKEDICV